MPSPSRPSSDPDSSAAHSDQGSQSDPLLGPQRNGKRKERSPGGGDSDDRDRGGKIKRAAQACVRCRQSKLRCLGGQPCIRCKKHSLPCEFQAPAPPPPRPPTTHPSSLLHPSTSAVPGTGIDLQRFSTLEENVGVILRLLAGREGGAAGGSREFDDLAWGGEGFGQGDDVREYGAYGGSGKTANGNGMKGGESNAVAGPSSHQFSTPALPNSALSNSSFESVTFQPFQNYITQQPVQPRSSQSSHDPSTLRDLHTILDSQSVGHRPPPPPLVGTTYLPPLSSQSHPSPAYSLPRSDNSHHRTAGDPSPNHPISLFPSLATTTARASNPTDGPSPESRLARTLSPRARFSPPFKAITFDPKVWENQSRRASPERGLGGEGLAGRVEVDEGEGEVGVVGRSPRGSVGYAEMAKDDPIGLGIIGDQVARGLYQYFAINCHPFLPVVDLEQQGDAYRVIRKQSPFLFTTIIAIAARFATVVPDNTTFWPNTTPPTITSSAYHQLAALAEDHLLGSLSRKSHTLSDVQSTMLLAGYGLQQGGKGPDSWVLTGHAFRMSRRLGMHKDDMVLAREGGFGDGVEGEKKKGKYMARRRTWFCLSAFDCLLSLGFGRPPSQPKMESMDTTTFLEICTSRPLYNPMSGIRPMTFPAGDFWIASQAQLMQIARSFLRSLETIRDSADQPEHLRSGSEGGEVEVTAMCFELNDQLEGWCKAWVWNGAPFAPYLNNATRNAKLCADHLRLCINAVILRLPSNTPPNTRMGSATSWPPAFNNIRSQAEIEDELLDKAYKAAISIINTHVEASEQDMALSYATDYLSITLAHAALFLIRLSRLRSKVDKGIIQHHIQKSINAAERSEKSSTTLLTNLARMIKDVGHAAGFADLRGSQRDEVLVEEGPVDFDPLAFLNAPQNEFSNPLAMSMQEDYLQYLFSSDPNIDFNWT